MSSVNLHYAEDLIIYTLLGVLKFNSWKNKSLDKLCPPGQDVKLCAEFRITKVICVIPYRNSEFFENPKFHPSSFTCCYLWRTHAVPQKFSSIVIRLLVSKYTFRRCHLMSSLIKCCQFDIFNFCRLLVISFRVLLNSFLKYCRLVTSNRN
jgi:hypothetical protein